ncbi:MAG: sulfite exporter TauE/SafE family protein [Acidobacteriota bacterium]|nr:sulfite exporter TauE/SafE family protein [Acidobacteriota bacterium]
MLGSDSIFVLMLLAGLAGGLGHCSGMCGPLVILLSPRQTGRAHTLQLHLGRILSYALIGATLAVLSAILALEVEVFPARRLLLLTAGIVLILSGLATLGLPFLQRGWSRLALSATPLRRASRLAEKAGPFLLGLFWGLLPCGLLYSAYTAAAATGAAAPTPLVGALQGAAVMVLFGLGTTPTLVGISWAAGQVPVRARVWLQRVAGGVVVVSGVVMVVGAL